MKRPVIGFVVAAFLVIGAPLAASAQSADMQSQISALLQQIRSLQQQLVDLIKQQQASSTPATALKPQPVRQRWCAIIRTLAEGAQGADVIDLQSFLKERGYLNDDASGYFGPLTAAAVASRDHASRDAFFARQAS